MWARKSAECLMPTLQTLLAPLSLSQIPFGWSTLRRIPNSDPYPSPAS